jgi:NAD-dependent dihydropyrimidine dehydrogenase PreA subunit
MPPSASGGRPARSVAPGDAALAARLAEICPVDIYADAGGRVAIVEDNVDECILCDMCVGAAPPGAVRVHRLYDAETVGS